MPPPTPQRPRLLMLEVLESRWLPSVMSYTAPTIGRGVAQEPSRERFGAALIPCL
jgi:hypothetical protein